MGEDDDETPSEKDSLRVFCVSAPRGDDAGPVPGPLGPLEAKKTRRPLMTTTSPSLT